MKHFNFSPAHPTLVMHINTVWLLPVKSDRATQLFPKTDVQHEVYLHENITNLT